MIVLHPSSRCDVCLDPYTWNTSADTPHVISCGHIFCKTCLRTVTPSLCPLCRKAFQPDRAKKLHVDRPPESSSSERQLDLFQRLALASGESTPPENVAEIVEELERWLGTQPIHSELPLRLALDAHRRHRELRAKHALSEAERKKMKRKLRHAENNANYDNRTAQAVEQSLLTRLQEVQDEHAAKLAVAESELEALRAQVARFHNPINPLPPPPEPVPLNRFSHSVNAVLEALAPSDSRQNSQSDSYWKHSGGDQGRGYHHDPYTHGYRRYDFGSATSAPPFVIPEAAKRPGHTAEKDQPFRFGSQSTHIYAPAYKPEHGRPHTSHTLSQSQNHSNQVNNHRHKVETAPSVSPIDQVIPGPSRLPDTLAQPGSTHTGIVGDANDGITKHSPNRMTAPYPGPNSSYNVPSLPLTPLNTSTYTPGYIYAPSPSSGSFDWPPQAREHTERSGFWNAPAPIEPGSIPERRSRRSSTAALPERPIVIYRDSRTASGATHSGYPDDRSSQTSSSQFPSRTSEPTSIRADTARRSSWGTVNAVENMHNVSFSGNSANEFGLTDSHGVAGRIISGTSERSRSVRFAEPNPSPYREDDDCRATGAASGSTLDSPRLGRPEGRDVSPHPNDYHGNVHVRSGSHSAVNPQVARPDQRHGRHSSIPTSGLRVDNERGVVNDRMPENVPPAVTTANALALTFDPSLSPLTLNRSHSPNTSASYRPPITAPTPIISTQNLMCSWTLDNP